MTVQIEMPHLRLSNAALAELADKALGEEGRIHAPGAEHDIWGKNPRPLPAGAVFLFAHRPYIEIEHFEQLVWFNRTEARDELWAVTNIAAPLASCLARSAHPDEIDADFIRELAADYACVLSVNRDGTRDEATAELTAGWLSSPASQPVEDIGLIAMGYLSAQQYGVVRERVNAAALRERARREENARIARENQTEIIRVASELKLNPEPAGIGPIQWYANCPGTSHRLQITTGADQFGCGYCRRKGGVEELRRFVEERRGRR